MTPELRQKLLELHYGLLPEGEAAELRRRIESEPELAKAFAESQKTAATFAQAARLIVPKPAFKRPEANAMNTNPESSAVEKLPKPASARRTFGRGAMWFVGTTAIVLAMVAVGGFLFHRYEMAEIASQHLRLIVSGPSAIQSGVESKYSVSTTEITGSPMPATVEMELLSLDGKCLVNKKESTDANGRLQFTVPADMKLPAGATIKFVAWHPTNEEEKEEFSAPVTVEQIRYGTKLSLDKPLYQPGETVFFRSLTLSRFGMTAEREFPVHFEILDPSGAAVAGSQSEGATERGVGNGAFPIPAELAGGEYTLVAKSLDQSFPDEKRKFFVRQYRLPKLKKELEFARDSYAPGDSVIADLSVNRAEGGPAKGAKLKIVATVDGQNVFEKQSELGENGAYRIEFKLPEKIERGDGQLAAIIDDGGTNETQAKTIPINLGKVEVKFYPEGGDLVAGLENRVYFTGKNPLGKPVHLKGQVLNDRDEPVAVVETTYEGMGVFGFSPRPGGNYRLKIASPAGVKEDAKLPPVAAERSVVLNTGTGVFGANEPIEFNLRSAKPNLPLVVGAWCRGVQVGQQTLVTRQSDSGMNPVSLALPEGIGGVVRLTVFDYSDAGPSADPAKQPKPIAERLVYRRLEKKLGVKAVENREKYSPGEKVQMSLVVTNEKGEPTPAALGVAVVDDALLNLADDKTANLTTHFLLTTEIDKPEDLEKADFYLSDDAKGQVKGATALDLLLGTQGWRRFVEKTLPELKQEGPEKEQLTRLVALSGTAGPPTLFDNLSKVRKSYDASIEAYNLERAKIVNLAIVLCLVLVLGLLLMVLMLGILRLVRGFRFWLPALAAASGLAVVGFVMLAPGRFDSQNARAVAFLQYHAKGPDQKWLKEVELLRDRLVELKKLPQTPETEKEVRELAEQYVNHWARYPNFILQNGRLAEQDRIALFGNGVAPDQQWFFDELSRRGFNSYDGLVWDTDKNVELGLLLRGQELDAAQNKLFLGIPRGNEKLGDADFLVFRDQARKYKFNENIGGMGGAGAMGGMGMGFGGRGKGRPQGEKFAAGIFELGELPAVEKKDEEVDRRYAGYEAQPWYFGFQYGRYQGGIPEQYRFAVREYAHEHVAGEPGVRSDFAETLYWNPLLIAGADGRAPVSFELSDSVTTFRLIADAHGAGRIGSGGTEIVSRIPFNLDPKLPLEVNAGDRIDLPLAVANDSPNELDVSVKIETGDLVKLVGEDESKIKTMESGATAGLPSSADPSPNSSTAGQASSGTLAERKLKLAAGTRGREYFGLDVTGQKGECPVTVRGAAGVLSDAVSRKLKIVPPGFPKNASYAGRIDGPQEVKVRLPEQWVHGSLEVTLNAFPTTLANLQNGLAGILQEPNGCFEQASTSNYPNVMTMQYLEDNNLADPAVMRRSKDLMQKGYAKLTGYECKQKGYEWFGGDPGHEALTAYGLMQFRDMKQVYEVDGEMIKRTADWLLARRDGKGGYLRNDKALDSFGQAPAEVTDAYITWALCESGEKGLDAEVAHAIETAEKTEDAYVVALAASAAIDAGKAEEGKKLLDKLAKLQADDGHLEGKLGSITRSGGVSLQIESTALAALAWLKQPAFTAQANKAIEWIVKNRQGGGSFGGTQATILALKALVGHAKANKTPVTAGKLLLLSKDVPLGERPISAGQQETITIGGLEAKLKPGDNDLTIVLTGENKMPYSLDVSYRTTKPESEEKCPVRLKTSLAKKEAKAGETVELSSELSNSTDQGQPMTIAILGLPAGLEPRADQLDELKKAGTIDYYETRGRELIFYWRSLAPKKQIAWKLDLIAAIPGKYSGPASRAYLYYTPEQKQWVDPLEVEISR